MRPKRTWQALLVASVSVVSLMSSADAAEFSYPTFNGVPIVTNSSATISGGTILNLTPPLATQRGSAWYIDKLPVRDGFSTTFEYQIISGGGSGGGGDGFAFLIQNESLAALGGMGSGRGYATSEGVPGITNSVAIEFATTSTPRISVQTCGLAPNSYSPDYSLGSTGAPILSSGNITNVRIEYASDPGSLSVFVGDLATPLLQVPVDIDETLDLDEGCAWLGFTAGTGMGWAQHDILSWSYAPGPATLCLFALGGLAVIRRKR